MKGWNLPGRFIENLPSGVFLVFYINNMLDRSHNWEFPYILYNERYRVFQRFTGLVRDLYKDRHICFMYTHILLRHKWHFSNASLMKTYTQTNKE